MHEPPFYKQPTLVGRQALSASKDLPQRVGPYAIESLLGQGGMSLLYLGVDPATHTLVTVKVLLPEYIKQPHVVERFHQESQLIRLTNHPNVVKLHGEGRWEGGLYIAMEFIQGISLKQFITQHSLSIKRSIDILVQAAHALDHLHAHGIIHGDLKPENILINEEGVVKVIDFGIARLHIEEAAPSHIFGTPTYMSPEQKDSPAKMSFLSDIYALGVIAYELFVGRLCFGIVHISQVPTGLRPILEKMLAVSPQERYQSPLEAASDLLIYLHSDSFMYEKTGADQIKEILESLQSVNTHLSLSHIAPNPHFEGAIVHYKILGEISPYIDVVPISHDVHMVALALPVQGSVENTASLGIFHGMMRALAATATNLTVPSLMTQLHALWHRMPSSQHCKAALLYLDARHDQLQLACCGLGAVIHVPEGRMTARQLRNVNPVLGPEIGDGWNISTDRWSPGDTVVFHTFPVSTDQTLLELIPHHASQSVRHQADLIMNTVMTSVTQKAPHTCAVIQRRE